MPKPLTLEEALDLARQLLQSGRLADAAQVCTKVLEAVPVSALVQRAPAFHLLAQIEYRQGDIRRAVDSLRSAIGADPRLPEAHNDLGNLLQISGAPVEAVACYQKALELRPEYAEAHRNLASALRRLGRLDEAVNALEAAVSFNPNFAEALAQLAYQLKQRCEWDRIGSLTARLIDAVAANSAPVNPFVFLSLETTADQQLQCARQWWAAHFSGLHSSPRSAKASAPKSGKITIGYLSADFQEHATAHLIGELFALHYRSRFRIIGYSYGKDDGSPTRRRLAASFDSFVDFGDGVARGCGRANCRGSRGHSGGLERLHHGCAT